MRDRSEQILRYACIALAALVLMRLVGAGCHVGALVGAKIPPVPTLETNSVSSTNAIAAAKGTNAPLLKTGDTNSPKSVVAGTNIASDKMTNAVSTNQISMTTNSAAKISVPVETNSIVSATNLTAGTNAMQNGTNNSATSTNSAAGTKPKKSRKNSSPDMAMAGDMESGGFSGMSGMPGMPGKAPKLPPEIQARVDKIVDSEIFAPIQHPLPMALMGIAGDTAFLRTASGQTGLVKAGDSLGEVKLLRIGINRVLVEADGEKKELTIFDGYGGESLLPQPKENSK